MIRVISLDMDGTLMKSGFVDKVWMEGMPMLYAEKSGVEFALAKEFVIGEYMKIGSDRLEYRGTATLRLLAQAARNQVARLQGKGAGAMQIDITDLDPRPSSLD